MSLELLPSIKDKELRRLEKIKSNCPICSGAGFVINSKNELDDCKCVKRIKEEYSLLRFNIPPKYRRWTLEKLDPDFRRRNKKSVVLIEKYIQTLEEKIDAGKGLWLNSPPGLAKSSMICYILKNALKKGYVPYFGRASYFIDVKFKTMGRDKDAEDARNFLKFLFSEVDILAIEEIDKVHLPNNDSMPNKLFYEFLSEAYDANISLLISSNKERSEFEKQFPWFIKDRLATIQNVPFSWGARSGRSDA